LGINGKSYIKEYEVRRGYLSEHFSWFGWKILSQVEINPVKSHQHEFAAGKFRDFLGESKQQFDADFIFLGNDEDETIIDKGILTYYDSREMVDHRGPEYRFYYTENSVVEAAAAGDLLIIGMKNDGNLHVIIARQDSTAENQISWLFDIKDQHTSLFSVRRVEDRNDMELHFSAQLILQLLGIEAISPDLNYLEGLVREFGSTFPATSVFSSYARKTLPEINSIDGADMALTAWLKQEEILFKTLEKHIIAEKLKSGFGNNGDDVDEFISYSLSVQNRRKSRAGYALENNLEQIFIDHGIRYSRGKITENKNRPDFIFPDIDCYLKKTFPTAMLSMLACKTTCKDRWRQILPEADRIELKHLITLEPSISENQTAEMHSKNVQLIVPADITNSYTDVQRSWLMNVETFLGIISDKQRGGVEAGNLKL
jgi:hypothetical protein